MVLVNLNDVYRTYNKDSKSFISLKDFKMQRMQIPFMWHEEALSAFIPPIHSHAQGYSKCGKEKKAKRQNCLASETKKAWHPGVLMQ